MATLQDVMNSGQINKENFPDCNKCKKTKLQMAEDGMMFLVCVRGEMVCGNCAIEMTKTILCKNCDTGNTGGSKFCRECGGRL